MGNIVGLLMDVCARQLSFRTAKLTQIALMLRTQQVNLGGRGVMLNRNYWEPMLRGIIVQQLSITMVPVRARKLPSPRRLRKLVVMFRGFKRRNVQASKR